MSAHFVRLTLLLFCSVFRVVAVCCCASSRAAGDDLPRSCHKCFFACSLVDGTAQRADGAQKHQRAGRCSSGDEGEEEEEGSCTRWHTELHCRAIQHRVLRDVESVYTGLGSTNVGQPDQGKCKDFQKVCWLFVYVELGSISERVTLFLF